MIKEVIDQQSLVFLGLAVMQTVWSLTKETLAILEAGLMGWSLHIIRTFWTTLRTTRAALNLKVLLPHVLVLY